ncbi:cytochrome b/b6 domain-containing protein [Sphingomonas sp. LY29]|uniref:cytochrome b n=1 Tax=Sphingomonas sp. LY29 TaxID=3095341 RepID=UPI002D78FAE7|nr:cytochrome b/b6 domain-containing protein [Sphingomonas sp. LY29]WRP26508.1 cytochrome b/b6 domain-containing protein [Sphingomonas sp. LY29]
MIRAIRRWAKRHSRKGRYTPVGITFHWVMAALVLYQLGSGWMMERIAVGGDKIAAYAHHSEIGLTLLLLASLRFVWRAIVPGPINDADIPGWQAVAAHATHILFYGLFALLPLSGWAMWSALQPAAPLSIAGVIPVPAMPFYDLSPEWQRWILDVARQAHGLGVVGLALLVPMHVGAALKHHFWDRHDVLEGMLPEIEDSEDHPAGAMHKPTAPAPQRG